MPLPLTESSLFTQVVWWKDAQPHAQEHKETSNTIEAAAKAFIILESCHAPDRADENEKTGEGDS
jgi:hypothetical protein